MARSASSLTGIALVIWGMLPLVQHLLPLSSYPLDIRTLTVWVLSGMILLGVFLSSLAFKAQSSNNRFANVDLLAPLVDALTEPLIVGGADGRIRVANRSLCKLLRYEARELIGRDL